MQVLCMDNHLTKGALRLHMYFSPDSTPEKNSVAIRKRAGNAINTKGYEGVMALTPSSPIELALRSNVVMTVSTLKACVAIDLDGVMAFASSSPIELALRSSVVTTVSTLKTCVDGLGAIKTNRIIIKSNCSQCSIDLDSLYNSLAPTTSIEVDISIQIMTPVYDVRFRTRSFHQPPWLYL